MAKNLKAIGEVYDYVCIAAVVSGQVIVMGDTIGVALTKGAIGETIAVNTHNVWELPKLDSSDIAQGVKLYWDEANQRINLLASGNKYAGKAYVAAPPNSVVVQVELNA